MKTNETYNFWQGFNHGIKQASYEKNAHWTTEALKAGWTAARSAAQTGRAAKGTAQAGRAAKGTAQAGQAASSTGGANPLRFTRDPRKAGQAAGTARSPGQWMGDEFYRKPMGALSGAGRFVGNHRGKFMAGGAGAGGLMWGNNMYNNTLDNNAYAAAMAAREAMPRGFMETMGTMFGHQGTQDALAQRGYHAFHQHKTPFARTAMQSIPLFGGAFR